MSFHVKPNTQLALEMVHEVEELIEAGIVYGSVRGESRNYTDTYDEEGLDVCSYGVWGSRHTNTPRDETEDYWKRVKLQDWLTECKNAHK